MKHNEKMAQSLKEGLEEKYPNISLDINTIKRLGVQYTKWTRQKESERALDIDSQIILDDYYQII